MSGLRNSSASAASPVVRNSLVKRSMMRLFDSAVIGSLLMVFGTGLRGSWMCGSGVGEVAGQLAVGVDLGEEVFGLLLDGRHGVGSGDPAPRGVLLLGHRQESGGEPRGVAG